MTQVSVWCPAKVNLFLRILAREESGHHQIETFFQAVGLWDKVTVRRGDAGIALHAATAEWAAPELGEIADQLGTPQDNTVVRAAQAFFDATGCRPAVSIELAKAIPPRTGLGGASSDAAGTLAALNLLHDWPLQRNAVIEVGGRIGADVAFFCADEPSALAWGRGDRVLPCPAPPPTPIALVVPWERFATADAYRETSDRLALPAGSAQLPGLSSGDWKVLGALAGRLGNDFESTAFRRLPLLTDCKAALVKAGAVAAGLTGSGSALYGVFETANAAERAARRVGEIDGVATALVVPTLDAMPELERRT